MMDLKAKGKYDQRCLETVNTEKQLEQSKSKSAPKVPSHNKI